MADVVSESSDQDFDTLLKDIGYGPLTPSNNVPTTSLPSRINDGVYAKGNPPSSPADAMVKFRGNGLVMKTNNCNPAHRLGQQYKTKRAPEGYTKMAAMRQMMDKEAPTSNMGLAHSRIQSNFNRPLALTTVAPLAASRRKCASVYIGGTRDIGCSNALKRAACSRMRCTKCNYMVTRFYGKSTQLFVIYDLTPVSSNKT